MTKMILTTSINKIRRIKKRKKIIQGGSSSGKTYAILTILIDYCCRNANKSVSVISESMPHLRRGAVRDFLKIMNDTNRYIDAHYNKTSLTYQFANGSFMEFFSADTPDKLKGARRDVLYVNEANHISYQSYQQLAIRTREDIYLDYNPDRTFWAITEVAKEPDAELIVLNYKDNEALDKSVIEQFEINRAKAATSDYWHNWCKVYIDGELGSLEGAVLQNWQIIDNLPKEARVVGVGLDFGYTNDPTAAIEVLYWDGKYILNELFYRTNLTNNEISKMLEISGVSKQTEIWCDSAEPKSIKDLSRMGWRTSGTKKGADSVMWGLNIMLEQELLVLRGSDNLIEELENYVWIKDKTGKTTNKPIGAFDHAIDAARYLFMAKIGTKPQTRVPFVIGK